jgi:hypothetical protein
MKVRRTVFDSLSERDVFRALESRWSPPLCLYPSLPLAKIVSLEDGDGLSTSQRRYFYATNVDYTFCEADGRPLLRVEFDGIGHGFSRDGVYIEGQPTIDLARPVAAACVVSAKRGKSARPFRVRRSTELTREFLLSRDRHHIQRCLIRHYGSLSLPTQARAVRDQSLHRVPETPRARRS